RLPDGLQPGSAHPAVCVVCHHVAEDPDLAAGHLELGPLDAAEGLECGARGAAALRAVTDQRVIELIRDGVARLAAQAAALESFGHQKGRATLRFSSICSTGCPGAAAHASRW